MESISLQAASLEQEYTASIIMRHITLILSHFDLNDGPTTPRKLSDPQERRLQDLGQDRGPVLVRTLLSNKQC